MSLSQYSSLSNLVNFLPMYVDASDSGAEYSTHCYHGVKLYLLDAHLILRMTQVFDKHLQQWL